MEGRDPLLQRDKGKRKSSREVQDCIWTGERPRTETESDPISDFGAFFGLEPAPYSRTWRGGEPVLGAVVGRGLSSQLEKVVPSLEGCTIVQNLPASATLGTVAGPRAQSAGGQGRCLLGVLWEKTKPACVRHPRGLRWQGWRLSPQEEKSVLPEVRRHRQSQRDHISATLRGAFPGPEHAEQDFES